MIGYIFLYSFVLLLCMNCRYKLDKSALCGSIQKGPLFTHWFDRLVCDKATFTHYHNLNICGAIPSHTILANAIHTKHFDYNPSIPKDPYKQLLLATKPSTHKVFYFQSRPVKVRLISSMFSQQTNVYICLFYTV